MSLLIFNIIGEGMLTFHIRMQSNASVLDLKERIRAVLDVPVARQTLRYDIVELLDDETLAYALLGDYDPQQPVIAGNSDGNYDIQLSMSPLSGDPTFSISVVQSPCAEPLTVRVRETHSVAELKKKIERRLGIFGGRLTLFRLEEKMERDFATLAVCMEHDSAILADYYICQGCTIRAAVEMQSH